MENYFAMGDEVFVYGKLNEMKPRTLGHPETEVIEAGEESFIHINRIAPIYPLTEGLPQRWLRGLVWRTLEKFDAQIVEPQAGQKWQVSVWPLSPFRCHAVAVPWNVICSRRNRAWLPKTAPVRRWHSRQWQIQMRDGSPSTVR